MRLFTLLALSCVLSGMGWAAESASARSPIQVYAHRGVRFFAPENTMPAYRAGLRIGTDWVDMDILLTKDGEVLISHDLVLNPDITRDAQGKFLAHSKEELKSSSAAVQEDYIRKYTEKNLTLHELEQFDVGRLNPDSAYSRYFPEQVPVDGTRLPTLRDVIHYVNKTTAKKVGFQIEMKTDPEHPEYSSDPDLFAKALYKILKDEKIIDRAEIQAFDFKCLYALQKLDKRVKTAYLTSREDNDSDHTRTWSGGRLVKDYGSLPKMVKALGGYAWEPEDAELTKETLDEAHRLGLKVVVWTWPEQLGTAFDPKLVAKMIEWGVDGIITDDPGHLISMLAARGMRVPNRYKAD